MAAVIRGPSSEPSQGGGSGGHAHDRAGQAGNGGDGALGRHGGSSRLVAAGRNLLTVNTPRPGGWLTRTHQLGLVPRVGGIVDVEVRPGPAECRSLTLTAAEHRPALPRAATDGSGTRRVSSNFMRGEYKVPGGKLVAVDVEAEDGLLTQAFVSGDFFLEPDEALDDINSALIGMPTSASAGELAGVIERGLAPETQMIGFNPEAVGIAVRRALGHATDWSDHTFDVIGPVSMDPRMHVALDEVIAAKLARGEINPSLRIWDWDQPLVVIGSFQSYRNEIDDEGRERHGINVVRRITGGGAMFMEPGNCVTYSLVVPVSLVEGLSFERSYEFLDQWVMGALKELGVNARYVPLNDIASDKGKIAGAAQRRVTGGVVVHHVTMAYDIDADKMLEVLRIGREKMSDKGTKSANKRVDPLRSQTQMPRDDIIASFLKHFESLYDTQRREYAGDELERARQLVDTKFSSEEWTKRIP